MTAKLVSRALMPVLVTVLLGMLTWIGNGALATIREQGQDIQQIKTDMRVISTRLDEGVVRQVNNNAAHIDDHERRLQQVERKVGM
ncbi:hypothetical protein [Thermomonas sp.]|uniref:hypothetical protein n=1 Tax=Thermomonas sp. TaxID=1971895 RepID=UPI002635B671|nr:hypothetical protein [Thermomonas sp.]